MSKLFRFLIFLLCLQGVLMSKSVERIDIDGVEIPVIFEEQKILPIVSMQIVFVGGGSINDSNKSGLARLVSKMFNEGTLSEGSIKFAEILDERAISLSVSSGGETLNFELSSLKEEFAFGANMLKNLLKEPNLSDKAFKKVRTQTLGTISNKKSDFDFVANTKLKELMFENSPLGLNSLGTEESIKLLQLEDVKEFSDRYINLKNTIVVIGGDIDKESAKDIVKNILSSLSAGDEARLGFYNASTAQKEVIQTKDTEQAYIYFGAPLYIKVDDKDMHKLKVAGFILGEGGFGSRLMEEIRVKRGLAYSAYAKFSVGNSSSYMSGHLQTKNENRVEAKKIVKEVIEEFVKNGVTNNELEQAKKFLLGSEPLRLETLSQRMSRSFSEFYKGLEIGYVKKELELIEKLSLEELNEFIASHKEIVELIFSIVTNEDNRPKR